MSELPCSTCKFAWVGAPKDDVGWCYMFKKKPSGCFCGQYRLGMGLIPPQRLGPQHGAPRSE